MPTSPDAPGGRPTPVLAAEKMTAGYDGTCVITDVSIAVGSGEIVSVLGPNGAGKSTFLKALMGTAQILDGRVTLAGKTVTRTRPNELIRRGVGYVPQNDDVFATLTVKENLEMGGYLLSKSTLGRRTRELLETFPALSPMLDRTASKLSGGERKMVALARAMMPEPSVLLLDEPTANLSEELAKRLLEKEVKRLADNGTGVILVEQRALSALKISSWAYVLSGGLVALAAASQEVLAREDLSSVFLGRVESGQQPPRAEVLPREAAEI